MWDRKFPQSNNQKIINQEVQIQFISKKSTELITQKMGFGPFKILLLFGLSVRPENPENTEKVS